MGAAASTVVGPSSFAAHSAGQTNVGGIIDMSVLYDQFLQVYQDMSGRTLTQTEESQAEHIRLLTEFVGKVTNQTTNLIYALYSHLSYIHGL